MGEIPQDLSDIYRLRETCARNAAKASAVSAPAFGGARGVMGISLASKPFAVRLVRLKFRCRSAPPTRL